MTLLILSLLLNSNSNFARAEDTKTVIAEDAAALVPTEVMIAEDATTTKRGGSSSSIGTDAYDVRSQTAWFYGKKPITTCFNYVEAFGVSDGRARVALELAIKTWREYFAAKKIVRGNPDLSPNDNFKMVGRCKGNEDLAIYFGTGPIFANLSDLKAVQRLSFPSAYANKTHVSRDLKWGKGYVRLVSRGYYGERFPDWSMAGSLEGILIHELGHVLGFTHSHQTIMRSELVDQVFAKAEKAVHKIDGERELVTCGDCASTFHLVGAPKGPLFKSMELGPTTKLVKTASGYVLRDGKKERAIKESSRSIVESPKTLLANFPETLNDTSQAFTLYGTLGVEELKTPVVLEVNAGQAGGAIVLRSIENGEISEAARFDAD